MEEYRSLYSLRDGSRANRELSFDELKQGFRATYAKLISMCALEEAFGSSCFKWDEPGRFNGQIAGEVFHRTLKDHLWPQYGNDLTEVIEAYSEEDVFDIIELLFDFVSLPVKDSLFTHADSSCEGHYDRFDRTGGQDLYVKYINRFITKYGSGYRLSASGQVEELADPGLDLLLDAAIPGSKEGDIGEKISHAISLFRRYNAPEEDKKQAVRLLADVLEFLRGDAKEILNRSDEKDLFELANRFGIRHHNRAQSTNYDKDIWYRWMFYYYLATIHAIRRLMSKANPS